jgi:PIN domain nuclease of toxin-antitoxin system
MGFSSNGHATELERPSNELWLSPITILETIILVEKGRVVLDCDPEIWMKTVTRKIPFNEAPINHKVAIQSRRVDLRHQDPQDRFLAATCLVYDLTLVTADKRLLASKAFAVLPNR